MKQFLYAGVLAVLGLIFVGMSGVSAHVALSPAGMAALGLREGEIVGSNNTGDPDIFIVNEYGFKRLFISPTIFGFYGHLRYGSVKRFNDTVIESMSVSALFRNCETGDEKVYALEVTGEDGAVLHWFNVSAQTALADDSDFFKRIFCINTREFSWYTKGSVYTSAGQIPPYKRTVPVSQSVNDTSLPLTLAPGLRIAKFTPSVVGPLRFMAFSDDGILFASMPSAAGLYGNSGINDGKVFAFPDRNGDGVADETKTVLSGLHLPHGLAFHDGYLYVAEEGRVLRYAYANGGTLGAREVVVASLPTGGEHLSRTIVFGGNNKMYVSVGSPCNDCTNGAAGTASVWEFNADGTNGRIFARGLRNAVGLAIHPSSGELWATENSRDHLGDDLPPDEINIVREDGNYGWPYCYGRQVRDAKHLDYNCAVTQGSVFNTQAHSAPLGLAFVPGGQFSEWKGDLIVARHGSWNRTQPVGYDVVRLDVQGNTVVGEYPLISGWLTSKNAKLGRPVDAVFGPDGSLYISDDQADVIYRVTKTP